MSKLLKLGVAEGMPSECWELAFNRLNEDDLKSVSLVCKDFLATSNLVKKRLKPKHLDVTLLSRHLKRFTQLKEIDFRGFKGNLDEAICEMARSSGLVCLETLCFAGKSFKTQSLRKLGSNPNMKKNLKHLNCGGTKRLHDKDLVVIANLFPNLEQLNIKNFRPTAGKHIFTDYGIESLASKLKVLKKLFIAGAHLFTDQSVIALSLNCAFLEHVVIHGLPKVNDSVKVTEHGIGLLRNRPNLKHLSIARINKSLSNITIENSISHAKSLISLCFYCMDISDKLLMEIGKAKLQLKRFQIVFCRGFTGSGLCMLDYKYLHHLCIRNHFNAEILDLDEGIREIILKGDDHVANLTCIDISSFEVTTSTLFLLSTKCCSLVEIRFCGAKLSGQDNNIPLSKNHKLQKLHLCHSDDITDELLEQIGHILPSLKLLSLDGCFRVTSRGIEAILKSCKYITELNLRGYTKAKMMEANSEVAQVNLEELILEDSAIDDEGLAVIATKCPQLVHINLRGCREVTTNGIKQMVKNIKTLRRFTVGSDSEKVSVELLEWMLSTGYLASLKEIRFPKQTILTKGLKEAFMDRGCIMYFG
ncbi:Leucine-rich repeat, cysteine-containing subtype [Corchorus olitorius]|uniref:Leucine-rich repeat, cysteine-containing subtype n=1 Tax=Corchorus olitorius TaxID=93759 RepID=A0A1R3H4P9_9ROSI|nr:Leucine-rich repeat, cysteine-containing subtype [Corchorus olitorius]